MPSPEDTLNKIYEKTEDPWSLWSSQYEQSKYIMQIELARQFVDPENILEIGCSTGAFTTLLAHHFPRSTITALDISSVAIQKARAKVGESPNIKFEIADIIRFGNNLSPSSYELIFWSEGFSYLSEYYTISEISKTIFAVHTALRRHGIFIVTHILPKLLPVPALRNRTITPGTYHQIIEQYFRLALERKDHARKNEDQETYRYETRVYRPHASSGNPNKRHVGIQNIDVVIPARNEARTINLVVSEFLQSPLVSNVIVINNNSIDETSTVASEAGATVIECETRGYGRAVKAGLRRSQAQWVIKADADISNPSVGWIDNLIQTAQKTKVDIVKTFWEPTDHDPGLVTNLTVKPLLRLFYPEISHLNSPISGIYLLNKESFDLDSLPDDFSLDIALLIDALERGIQISETKISIVRHSTIFNGLRTCDHYFTMADEIMKEIVSRGLLRYG
jgi:ubiquinone/menaquinone biosynthesis C-methylase UbiE